MRKFINTIKVKDTVFNRDNVNNYSVQYSFINYNHIQYYHHKKLDFFHYSSF